MCLDIGGAQAINGAPTPGSPGDSSGSNTYWVTPNVLQDESGHRRHRHADLGQQAMPRS